jgi:hypothetical protein
MLFTANVTSVAGLGSAFLDALRFRPNDDIFRTLALGWLNRDC